MSRARFLVLIAALLAGSQTGCEQSTASERDAAAKASPARQTPAAVQALAATGTPHGHRVVEGLGAGVVHHPGWTERIDAVDAGGARREVYRRTGVHHGERPGAVALGFGGVAVSVFDPAHHVWGVTVETLDGQTWSFEAGAASARTGIVEGMPAERALAAVGTRSAHRAVAHAGGRVVHHPGWSSGIHVTEAGGTRTEVYRQTRTYHGAYPREVVLGFRSVALAVFDPEHRVGRIIVRTAEGEEWAFAEDGTRCPPQCPPDDEEAPPAP